MSTKAYGDFIPGLSKTYPSKKEMEGSFPTQMQNDKYANIMNGYLLCVSTYLSQISIPQILEKQLERRDIDTVCGYELFQMKKHFVESDVLEFKNFYPTSSVPAKLQ